MKKLLIEFEYDEKKLGKGWFNLDNLELCLFSQQHTKKELLKVKKKFLTGWREIARIIENVMINDKKNEVLTFSYRLLDKLAKAIAKRLEGNNEMS